MPPSFGLAALGPTRAEPLGDDVLLEPMFTGFIEAIGTVRADRQPGGGAVLELDTRWAPSWRLGDSLATNGVCLTVTARRTARARWTSRRRRCA